MAKRINYSDSSLRAILRDGAATEIGWNGKKARVEDALPAACAALRNAASIASLIVATGAAVSAGSGPRREDRARW